MSLADPEDKYIRVIDTSFIIKHNINLFNEYIQRKNSDENDLKVTLYINLFITDLIKYIKEKIMEVEIIFNNKHYE